jgi:Alfin/PHD-finger
VAIHSDSWLIAVAFFNAARLDAEGRRQLFNSINMLPTCFEVVSGLAEKEGSAAQVINRRNSRRSEDGGYAGYAGDPCPHCGRMYKGGEFWIQCDDCDRWFDGKCVDMNQQKAAQSTKWTCPFCFKDSVQ